MFKFVRFLLFFIFLQTFLLGNEEIETKKLNYLDAIVLGIVEGITEYLPVSSTGHLIITNQLLGLNEDNQNDYNSSYSFKKAIFAYIIIIQAGAILAVLLLYRKNLTRIFYGFLGKDIEGRKLGINLLISFLPAVIIGLSLNKIIEKYLGDNITAVTLALIIGAIVMLFAEKRQTKRKNHRAEITNLTKLSFKKSLIIGMAQCAALWPGMSRSMTTIVAGYYVGLSPKKSAEYSFLLGFITLSAASIYKLTSDKLMILDYIELGPLFVGILISFLSAVISIKFLINCLKKYGLGPFAWYRIILAIFILIFHLNIIN